MPLKWQRKKEAKKESFARFVFKFVLVSFSRLYNAVQIAEYLIKVGNVG